MRNLKFTGKLIGMAVLLGFSASAVAGWQLSPEDSSVQFISIKKNDIAEVHQFTRLSGGVGDAGRLNIVIDLASVDTGIGVRDRRMREYLFQVAEFPRASIQASVDMASILQAPVDAVVRRKLNLQLALHGQTRKLAVMVNVIRLDPDRILVYTAQPIIITAGDFGLQAGIRKLAELAKLPMISTAVPVNASFLLKRDSP